MKFSLKTSTIFSLKSGAMFGLNGCQVRAEEPGIILAITAA
jgi:hypothetical protein